jgi:hypothetical protein
MSSCLCWWLYLSVGRKWDNFGLEVMGYCRWIEVDRSCYTGCEVVCTMCKGVGRIGSDSGLVVAVVVVVGLTHCLRREMSHNPSIRTCRRGSDMVRGRLLLGCGAVSGLQAAQETIITNTRYIKASWW